MNRKIRKDAKFIRINELHGKEICEKYQSPNVLLADLASEYDCSGYIILKVLEYNGIKKKDKYELAKEANGRGRFNQRKYDLNFDYFKTWSSNMAYILGFIYADGNIAKGRHTLSFSLQRSDEEFLRGIKDELGYTGIIGNYESSAIKGGKKYPTAVLAINSMDMIQDLKNLGLTPNKSLTKTYPNVPDEFQSDFIRGYFDGNGTVDYKDGYSKKGVNSKTIQIRTRISNGSQDFLDGLQEVLSYHGIKQKTVNSDKRNSSNRYELTYSTIESKIIYDLMYKDKNCMMLKRKKEVYEEGFKKRREYQQKYGNGKGVVL